MSFGPQKYTNQTPFTSGAMTLMTRFDQVPSIDILLMEEILHQLRLVVYPIIFRVLYIPGGCLGSQPINSHNIFAKKNSPAENGPVLWQLLEVSNPKVAQQHRRACVETIHKVRSNQLRQLVGFSPTHSHSIHGTGIFIYMSHKNQPIVGKYTSPMDPMGFEKYASKWVHLPQGSD